MLYRDIVKARLSGNMKRLNEASLSRVWSYVQGAEKKSVALISAFRRKDKDGNKIPHSANVAKSKELMSKLQAKGYGPTKLIGHWLECTDSTVAYKDCPKEKLELTKEITFAIVGTSRAEALKLCQDYVQDAVIYLGPETKGKAALIFPDGSDQILGEFSGAKIAQGYSRIRGRPFTFEGFDMRPDSWVDALTEMVLMGHKAVRETARGLALLL